MSSEFFRTTAKHESPFGEKELRERSLAQLREIESDPDAYIDKGGAGIVYRLPQGICMKVFKERHEAAQKKKAGKGNTSDEEALFLQRLSHFHVEDVRSPKYVGHIRRESFDALVMEELAAVNLAHILSGTHSLPESYNHHTFFNAVELYLDRLHAEAGVIHGDLEARNIMIDIESGSPRIIDFGRSFWISKLGDERQRPLKEEDHETLERVEEKMRDIDNNR